MFVRIYHVCPSYIPIPLQLPIVRVIIYEYSHNQNITISLIIVSVIIVVAYVHNNHINLIIVFDRKVLTEKDIALSILSNCVCVCKYNELSIRMFYL